MNELILHQNNILATRFLMSDYEAVEVIYVAFVIIIYFVLSFPAKWNKTKLLLNKIDDNNGIGIYFGFYQPVRTDFRLLQFFVLHSDTVIGQIHYLDGNRFVSIFSLL